MFSNPVNQVRNTMSKGSGLLLVATDIDPVNEVDLNRWYDEEHIAERLTCPGFVRARRYKAVEGGPKYLALYDLTSLDALNTDMYKHLVGDGRNEWTLRIQRQMKNYNRSTYECISDRTK
jgi:hypothetical protein